VILLFVHGWGFDAAFWEPLAARLPDWEQQVWDRGYFGERDEPVPQAPCIAITHSFGAMRLLQAPPPDCRALVAINGFDRFAVHGAQPGVPVRVLDRMIARLEQDPAAVVADFRARCGSQAPFGKPDMSCLNADLVMLRDGDCSTASMAWHPPLLSLQGDDDPLLPANLRDSAFKGAPNLIRADVKEGGHLLPITQSAYCAAAIRNLAERAE